MKKLTWILMLAALLWAAPNAPVAQAAATPVLTINGGSGQIGDTVRVDVDISNNPGLTAAAFGLVYNSVYLAPVSYETVCCPEAYVIPDDYLDHPEQYPEPALTPTAVAFSLLTNRTQVNNAAGNDMASYSLISPTQPAKGDGTIASFYFTITAAAAGLTEISLDLVQFGANSWLRNSSGATLTPTVVKGSVKILNKTVIGFVNDEFTAATSDGVTTVSRLEVYNADSRQRQVLLITAGYDARGRMLAAQTQLLTIDAATNAGDSVAAPEAIRLQPPSGTTIAKVSAFLCDPDSYAPFCPAQTGTAP